MQEAFLHFVWQYGMFKGGKLKTTENKNINIFKPGLLNPDSGPDFPEAIVEIDNLLWAGQVEIHVKASEWYQHGHQNDDAYGNVILHVVYENDEEIYDKNGVIIPCLELKGMIQFEAQEQYIQFLSHSDRIACKSRILSVPALKVIAWTERMMVERLEFKSAQ